jgi:tetratricopeptide (TPR) repeat protein
MLFKPHSCCCPARPRPSATGSPWPAGCTRSHSTWPGTPGAPPHGDSATRGRRTRKPTTREADIAWREVRALLDEEIARLPEAYRTPFVLCHLEESRQADVARELGLKEGTVWSRLAKARKLLRERLARRGIELTAVLAAATVAEASRAAAAAHLETALARAAGAVAAGAEGAHGLSARVLALAEGGLKTMALTKVKLGVVLLLGVSLILAGGGALAQLAVAEKPSQEGAMAGTGSPAQGAGPGRANSRPKSPSPESRKLALELLQEAVDTLEGLPNDDSNRTALADIAVVQARLRQRDASRATFQRARQLVDDLRPPIRSQEWRELARAYARAGDLEAALGVVKAITDDEARNRVRGVVAETLARAGRGKEALQVAESAEGKESAPALADHVRTELALALARAGKFAEARAAVALVKDKASRVLILTGVLYSPPTFTALPDPGLALLRAKAGSRREANRALQEAARLVASLTDPAQKQRALAAVVCARARLGELPEALELLKGITDESWRNIAVGALAEALAAAGKAEEAKALVNRMPGGAGTVHGLHRLAVGQAEAGDRDGAAGTFQKAIALAKSLPEAERPSHFHNIASAQARAGDFKGAKQTAQEFIPQSSITWSNLAEYEAKAGKMSAAIETAERCPSAWWKGRTFRRIAQRKVEMGQQREALAWARKLSSPELKANALLGLAEGLTGHR